MIDPVPLLQTLIRIPSCEPPGGELAVARRVHGVMRAAGIAPGAVLAQLVALLPLGVSLEITDFKPAVEEQQDSRFVSTCAAAATRETGREPARLGVSYYSDAAILLAGHAAPFCILGPGTIGLSGTRDEWVAAEDVRRAARIYQAIAEEWLA
jgi:succinyl-diaminopimelate desuccinylase